MPDEKKPGLFTRMKDAVVRFAKAVWFAMVGSPVKKVISFLAVTVLILSAIFLPAAFWAAIGYVVAFVVIMVFMAFVKNIASGVREAFHKEEALYVAKVEAKEQIFHEEVAAAFDNVYIEEKAKLNAGQPVIVKQLS